MDRRTERMHGRGLTAIVLVCTTDREEHACCSDADGRAVADAARDWLRERDRYWTSVAVAETSCLGMCSEDGAAVVVQPLDEWFAEVGVDDVPALMRNTLGTTTEGNATAEPVKRNATAEPDEGNATAEPDEGNSTAEPTD